MMRAGFVMMLMVCDVIVVVVVIHIIRNMLIELRLLVVVGVQCMVGHLSCVCV